MSTKDLKMLRLIITLGKLVPTAKVVANDVIEVSAIHKRNYVH